MFIQSRNLVENGGLIVAKARHVELAGGTGAVSCSVMYYQELIMCRGEYLMLYSPVIYDCAEVKRLPFRVT